MKDVKVSAQLLDRLGIRKPAWVVEGIFLESLESAADVLATVSRASPHQELTQSELQALNSIASPALTSEDIEVDPIVRTMSDFAALRAASLDVSRAAQQLGVDESRIRQRLIERTLYGFKVDNRWCIPLFQLEDRGLVPGIERVTRELDPDLHPVAVYRWFTSPSPDLTREIDGEEFALSPLDWLRAGFPPQPVAELAAAI